MRLELCGQCVVLVTSALSVTLVPDAGLAGLAITSALSLVSILIWGVRQATEVELGMNSVERLTEYLAYESERPAIVAGNRCGRARLRASAVVCSM